MDKERVNCFIRAALEIVILSLVKDHQYFWILIVLVLLGQAREIIKFFKFDDEHLPVEYTLDEDQTEDPSLSWMNDIISTLWTTCLSEFLTVDGVTHLLEEGAILCDEKSHPFYADFLRKIQVTEMTVGNPVQVRDLSVLCQSRDSLSFKLDVVYPGLATVGLNSGALGGYCSAEVLQIEFSLQIILEPFSDSSLLGGISLSFLEPPKLLVEGGGLLWLPIEVGTLLMESLGVCLMEYLVIEPKQMRINFPASLTGQPALKTLDPTGILRVMLVEGNLTGASDPFAYLRLGRDFARTNTAPAKSGGGKWNFYTEFPVLQPGPTDQELKIEFWNRNRLWENDSLGMSSIDLSNLDDGDLSDIWLDVSSVDGSFAGEVRCLLEFVPCSTEITSTSRQGILVIFIRKIETTRPIEPVIVAQVSGEKPCYTVTGRAGQHFSFEEQITVLVSDIENDQLRIVVGNVNHNFDLSSLALKAQPRFLEETGNLICKELPHKEEHLHYETVGELILPVSQLRNARDFDQQFHSKTATGSKVEFSTKLFAIPDDFQEENKLLTYVTEL